MEEWAWMNFNMDIIILLDLLIESVVFLVVFFFIYQKNDRDQVQTGVIMQQYSTMLKDTTEKFIQELSKVQINHFNNLERTSTKQLQILERQTKDYMKGITDLAEALKPTPAPIVGPDLLDKVVHTENTIEKEEIPEQSLEDMSRIPLVDGINFQFEGEEEIIPFTPS